MAEAICQNDGCEKGSWILRKPLSEYQRGPTCPECGTTRVEVVSNEQTQPTQPQQAQAPAQVQEAEAAPAPAPTSAETAPVEAGAGFGRPIYNLIRGDEAEQERARGQLLQSLGAAAASAGQQLEAEAQKGRQRAQQHAGDELQKSDDFPECAECGGQVRSIPEDVDTFPCPHCGVSLQAP